MSDWRVGYRRALVDALVRLGSPLADRTSVYGWTHEDWQEIRAHVRSVGIDYERTGEPEDTSWNEFAGTFADDDNCVYGVEFTLVLQNGSTHRWRVSARLGEVLLEVARDVLEKR